MDQKQSPGRTAAHLALAFLVGLATVFVVIKVVDKAYGAEPAQQRTVARCATDTTAPCRTVTRKMKRMAHRYRNGTIQHAHGFKPRRVFRHPKASKRIAVKKIEKAQTAEISQMKGMLGS